MSDENTVKTWWNQASVATASNQTSTTTSDQSDDDFVLDFWEDDTTDVEDSKTNVSNKNEDSISESDWDNIKKSEWNEKISWLDESSKNDEKTWDNEDSKDNESSKTTEKDDWDEMSSWLDDNNDSLNGDDLFDDETENVEDTESNKESESVKDNKNEDNVNNEDNENKKDIESSETTGKDDWNEMPSWLDDNDRDSLDGDDLFDDEAENVEGTESVEEAENIEYNESTKPSDTIENNNTVSELDSDDNFDIDLDSPSNDDSIDSNQLDSNDDNEDINEETKKEVADSEDNEELWTTDTESDSNFQLDLDSNQESWEESVEPADLDWIEEESNSEKIDDSEINNEQFEDNNDMNNIDFHDDESNNGEIHNEDIDDDKIYDSSIENEWNDEDIEFTDSADNESIDSGNMSVDIDFTENVNDEDNSNEINNPDILWNVDFSNDLDNASETLENNANENSEQNPGNIVDIEFNLSDSSNSESDLLQNNSIINWINNSTNQNNETQLNDTLDNSKPNDSQALSFDLSNGSEAEENIEQQPNLQDYLSNQTSDEVNQWSGEEIQESNQPIDAMNFNNDSSNENNNSDIVLNNSQPESVSFDFNESQPVDQPMEQTVSEATEQDTPANQENTKISNWFSLDFTESNTNSDSNIQKPINQDIPQENQFTTLPTELSGSSTEINNDSTISDNTDSGINFTLWGEEPNNQPEVVQVQSTLSLDQILDSELSSNPQYSNNSVAIPENAGSKKSKSNKLGLIFAWGLFVAAGIVAVLAFPSLLPNLNPGGTDGSWGIVTIEDHWTAQDTGLEIQEPEFTNPDFPEPEEPDTYTTWDNPGVTSLEWTTVRSTVEFPDPYGWMDDNEWIDGLNNDPEPTPYIWSSDDIVYDEDPEEYEQILINDIKSSISSFKSDAEWYYSYGQEHSDRRIIKYASQIIHACDTYESQISAWEWISQEALSEFESKVLDIFNKIDNYNNWWEGSTPVIQNNTTQNKDDNGSSEKDEMREYIYSRQ